MVSYYTDFYIDNSDLFYHKKEKMKKNFFILLFVLVSMALFSCSRTSNNTESKMNSEKIIGTWNMDFTHIIKYINGKRVKDKNETFETGEYSKITFKPNETYVATSFTDGHKVTEKGIYSLKNGKLTTKPSSVAPKSDASPSLPPMNCEINGNRMTLSIKGNSTVNGKQQKFNMKVRLQKEESN